MSGAMQRALPSGPSHPRRRFAGPRAVFALMLREMASTYGRSPGGYLWAVLDPLAGVILLTLVFSFAFRHPPLGTNFPLFYATGYLPFMAYSELTMKIGQAIRYSRPLLTYPSVTYLDALISRCALNLLTDLVVFALLVTGIGWYYELTLEVDVLRLANALGMLTVLVMGVGALNCYLFGTFPVWERIWSILNRPLFFLSGVFFVADKMGETFRNALFYNPLTHIICEIRAAFYPIYDAPHVSPLYVYGVGGACLFIGLILLQKHNRFLITEGA